jgi:NitT/TauT family transport system substrate-binding protein
MDAETLATQAAAEKPLIEGGDAEKRGVGVMTRERWGTLERQLVELGIVDKAPGVGQDVE